MRIDVAFLPVELNQELSDKTVVVIDVLRASSTIVTALENGARSVIPVESVEDAKRIAHEFGSSVLLGGERGGLKIDGFDLGNSPLEYTRSKVAGKDLVFTTTNGTRAIHAARTAKRLIIAAFLNMASAVGKCAGIGKDMVIVCSGRCGTFSLEDSVCAGAFIDKACEMIGAELVLLDSAVAARQLYRAYGDDFLRVFRLSEHGRILESLGMHRDLEFCASQNVFSSVPVFHDGALTLD